MDKNQSQRGAAIFLPVTTAQHGNSGLDFDQAVVRWRQRELSRQKKAGKRLYVTAAKETARTKCRIEVCCNRRLCACHRSDFTGGSNGANPLIKCVINLSNAYTARLHPFIQAQRD